jgi:homoserine dehydrogenase
MPHYNLAFLGFGNVGRALAHLLESKRAELKARYDLDFTLTGLATRRLGWHVNAKGYSAADLQAGEVGTAVAPWDALTLADWLAQTQANVLFENTSLNPHTGQPAIDYIRTALQAGVHVITANKYPVTQTGHPRCRLAALLS